MATLLTSENTLQQLWKATKQRRSIIYGYSSTAAETASKEVVIQGNFLGWKLNNGDILAVTFANTNKATSVKFVVKWTDENNTAQSTAPITVKYGDEAIKAATKEFGGTTHVQLYYYDGTSFNWIFRDYGKPEEVQVPDEVVGGYYKKADSKFYKESAYTTVVSPQADVIYIDLTTEKLYVKDDSGQDLVKQASGNNVVDGYENGGYFYLTRSGTKDNYTYSDQVSLEADTLYVDKGTLQIFRATGSNLERMTYFTNVAYHKETSNGTTTHYIDFYNGPINSSDLTENRVARLDAVPFVKDGMVDTVSIVGTNLHITFNTDAGKQPIDIPISSIFDASNYYTKTEADNKYVAKVSGKGLSTNDYTAADKNKLRDIESGAQVNVLEGVIGYDGDDLTPNSNKKVTLPNVPADKVSILGTDLDTFLQNMQSGNVTDVKYGTGTDNKVYIKKDGSYSVVTGAAGDLDMANFGVTQAQLTAILNS